MTSKNIVCDVDEVVWLSQAVWQDDAQLLVGAQVLSFFKAPRDHFDDIRHYINKDDFI